MSQHSTSASPWEKGHGIRPRVVSIPEAAKYIGRSRSAIYDLLARGVIRAVKSDSRTLPIVEDLDRYLDSLPLADVRASHPEKFKDTAA